MDHSCSPTLSSFSFLLIFTCCRVTMDSACLLTSCSDIMFLFLMSSGGANLKEPISIGFHTWKGFTHLSCIGEINMIPVAACHSIVSSISKRMHTFSSKLSKKAPLHFKEGIMKLDDVSVDIYKLSSGLFLPLSREPSLLKPSKKNRLNIYPENDIHSDPG